jgi:hypothetical protein
MVAVLMTVGGGGGGVLEHATQAKTKIRFIPSAYHSREHFGSDFVSRTARPIP